MRINPKLSDTSNPLYGTEQRHLVYVIDDNVGVRRSLHFLLATSGFSTWPFACAFDFLDNLPNLTPAPILLHIRMPEIDGFDLMSELLNREIKWPIIVITGHANISIAVQAIKSGAIDLIEKPIEYELLEASLCKAIQQLGNIQFGSELQSNSRCLFEKLSPREMEILMLLMDGLPNKVVAIRLSLSVRTVEMHRANALQKLDIRSIAEVAHLARDAGITLSDRQSTLGTTSFDSNDNTQAFGNSFETRT